MYKEITRDGNRSTFEVSEFICDNVADLATLPTITDSSTDGKYDKCSPGSTCRVLENNSVYMLNNAGEWTLYASENNVGGGESDSGGSVTYDDVRSHFLNSSYVPLDVQWHVGDVYNTSYDSPYQGPDVQGCAYSDLIELDRDYRIYVNVGSVYSDIFLFENGEFVRGEELYDGNTVAPEEDGSAFYWINLKKNEGKRFCVEVGRFDDTGFTSDDDATQYINGSNLVVIGAQELYPSLDKTDGLRIMNEAIISSNLYWNQGFIFESDEEVQHGIYTELTNMEKIPDRFAISVQRSDLTVDIFYLDENEDIIAARSGIMSQKGEIYGEITPYMGTCVVYPREDAPTASYYCIQVQSPAEPIYGEEGNTYISLAAFNEDVYSSFIPKIRVLTESKYSDLVVDNVYDPDTLYFVLEGNSDR